MHRSKVPYFFLALAALLALAAVAVLIIKPGLNVDPADEKAVTPVVPDRPKDSRIPGLDDGPKDIDIATTPPEYLGLGLAAADPAVLVERIADALKKGDVDAIIALIGTENIDPHTQSVLERLAAGQPRLRGLEGMREIGELELNQRTRWVLELDEPIDGSDRVVVDLVRGEDGWKIERVTLPNGEIDPENPDQPSTELDSLGVADAFLQSVLRQDFQTARRFVDRSSVSDATIAGLCILFEEGEYQLRKSRPLRVLYQRGDTAGYLANVDAADGSQAAQFGINLRQASANTPWLVNEINLDQLLADYARRVAGGDVYYSPFVRNPGGGDTIALYFEFDDDSLGPRTARQLQIIAAVLLSDAGRRITLSGHTDALGTQDYNDELSARRAKVVRDSLVDAGVDPIQIVTVAKGASQPRRPNVTETGADDPDGRRANRRTEIYLDF
ncbi:MAG: OmpA family protein [Luteolibacter sp.]